MNFVVYPGFIVVNRVVLHCGPRKLGIESIDDLNFLEVNNYTALSSTGNLTYSIGLYGDLHSFKRCQKWSPGVPTGLSGTFKQSASIEVHSDKAFGDLVLCTRNKDCNSQNNYA